MKRRFSKFLSLILSIVMLSGVFAAGNITIVNATSNMTLAQLKQKFPAGTYWNHEGSSNNNPDGYTNTPCTHHGNCSKNGTDYSGWCGCNSFGSSIQCFGFANKLAYDAFGSLYTSWAQTSLANLKPGDVIRYKNNGHSIFVTGVSGDNIIFGDCNSDGHCKIRWDATISKSTVSQTLTAVYSAPSVLTVDGSSPDNPTPTPDPQPQDDTNIKTCIDGVDGGAGSIRVYGWAFDGDDVSQSIYVDVYIGGDSGDPNAEGHRTVANKSRPDVNTAFGCGSNHGIDETITTGKTGNQNVYIYAINIGAGSSNPLIAIKNVNISNSSAPSTDTTPPTITDPLIRDLSIDGYTLKCTVTDNVGVTRVLFPTWTLSGDQDDLVWHEGTISGNTASVYVKASDHKNETGPYITDIYAYDAAGNCVSKRIPDISLIPFVISYNMNGGTGSISNQSKMFGSSLTLSSTVPTRSGYRFVGWNTNKNATSAQYQPGGKYTANKDATLYAIWQKNSTTAVFHRNIGSSDTVTKSVQYTYGVSGQHFSDNGWTREGYTLAGWSTVSTATTPDYSVNSDVGNNWIESNSPTKYLYAVWKKIVTTAVFHRNIGSSDTVTKSVQYTYGVNGQHFSDNGWTLEGYTLVGWSTSPTDTPNAKKIDAKSLDLTGSIYKVDAGVWNEWMVAAYPSKDLYAVWQKNVTTAVFHRNIGGSNDTVTTSVGYTYGVNGQHFSDNGWTREGYTLVGWSTSPTDTPNANKIDAKSLDLTGSIYKVDAGVWNEWMIAAYPSIDLYAVWQKSELPLSNTSTVSSTSINLGEKITLTASAEGGTAPYTYALMYKKESSATWTKIGTKYGTASTGSFKPGKGVPYDIMINVKDATSKIKSKTFKVNVIAPLKNVSTISAESVKVGQAVKLTAIAEGGTAPYTYALMYKKSTATSWSKIGTKYGTASTGSFKPGKAVPYDIMINVKDSTGKIKSKTFTLNVTQ